MKTTGSTPKQIHTIQNIQNIQSLTTETSFTVCARDDIGFKMVSSIVSIHSVSYCSTKVVAAGVSILQIKAVDAVLGLIDKQ